MIDKEQELDIGLGVVDADDDLLDEEEDLEDSEDENL